MRGMGRRHTGAAEIYEQGRDMTDKAQRILQKINKRQALKRLANPERRDRILREFNQSTLGDVGAVGGDKGETFLKELNEMADLEGDAGRKSPDR